MTITYATFSQYTQVYSDIGLSETLINSYYLPHGALRVNQELGGCFTTPFSSNNHTARDLSIDFAHLKMLLRTRDPNDSKELKGDLKDQIKAIKDGNAPMITDTGESFFAGAGNTILNPWSSTENYKPTFDMRDPICQRVDPDLIDDLNSEDI